MTWKSWSEEWDQKPEGFLLHALWGAFITFGAAVLGWDWRVAALSTIAVGFIWEQGCYLAVRLFAPRNLDLQEKWEPSRLGVLAYVGGGAVVFAVLLIKFGW